MNGPDKYEMEQAEGTYYIFLSQRGILPHKDAPNIVDGKPHVVIPAYIHRPHQKDEVDQPLIERPGGRAWEKAAHSRE